MRDASEAPQRRRVGSIKIGDLAPGMATSAAPQFVWGKPGDLLVNETYQRTLSDRSMRLIRKIVGKWDWRKFKPPVVAQTAEGLEVLDGQHTAIAAHLHPGVAEIPYMIVQADQLTERAAAFVGQNVDRIALTPMALHAASIAAGDEDALAVASVCEEAGVCIVRSQPAKGAFKPGETMAVAAIRGLIVSRGTAAAVTVLKCLAAAGCAPIAAAQIKAAELLLHGDDYRGAITAAQITAAIASMGPQLEREAALLVASHKVRHWRALAIVIFKNRGRRAA